LLHGFTSLLVVCVTSGSGDFQSVLEFDLTGLAGVDPADLVSATVSLYAIDSTQFGFPTASPSAATPIDVTLFDAPTGFDQTTATWNNSPYARTAGSNLPTTTAYDTTVIDGIDQWFDFDATAALLAALQTSADATAFALASPAAVSNPTSGNEVSLFAYAAESSTIPPAAGLQPKLTVTLVPEPAALGLMLGLGSLALRRRSVQNR
ncbi:MAG: DNRLRE domain-containing protein, partial [Planctomycetota bacterium]